MWDGLRVQVFFLCLIAMLWITAASRGPQEHGHRRRLASYRHRERRKDGHVLHRSKRGWVWNQFFVIEEYTGPDPVLVGRVRDDTRILFHLQTRVRWWTRSVFPQEAFHKFKALTQSKEFDDKMFLRARRSTWVFHGCCFFFWLFLWKVLLMKRTCRVPVVTPVTFMWNSKKNTRVLPHIRFLLFD